MTVRNIVICFSRECVLCNVQLEDILRGQTTRKLKRSKKVNIFIFSSHNLTCQIFCSPADLPLPKLLFFLVMKYILKGFHRLSIPSPEFSEVLEFKYEGKSLQRINLENMPARGTETVSFCAKSHGYIG